MGKIYYFLLQLSRTIQCCKLLERFAARMFMRIWPMESNLLNSASDFLYDTHFYFNILSLAAKISARPVINTVNVIPSSAVLL